MFQTGVLIHDDIIDNAATRRGRYTIQRRYEQRMAVRGTKMLSQADDIKDVSRSAAICIGDYGIYEANRILAEGEMLMEAKSDGETVRIFGGSTKDENFLEDIVILAEDALVCIRGTIRADQIEALMQQANQ